MRDGVRILPLLDVSECVDDREGVETRGFVVGVLPEYANKLASLAGMPSPLAFAYSSPSVISRKKRILIVSNLATILVCSSTTKLKSICERVKVI